MLPSGLGSPSTDPSTAAAPAGADVSCRVVSFGDPGVVGAFGHGA
jgi:hypothetical protein